MSIRASFLPALFILWASIAKPQSTPLICATSAVNPTVHAEGIAETLGDILLSCSGGSPGSTITLNFIVSLNVGVTNRISASNATDVSLTVDSGSGPVPAAVPGLLQSSNTVSFNGVTFTIPASAAVNFRLSNLRGNITQAGGGFQQPILAVLSVNGIPSPLISNATQLSVGVPVRGLLASLASTGIRCVGSALPDVINFTSLFNGGTRFVSTRVTEGYPDAFQKKAGTNQTGIRIRASYAGFPAGARIFVPDVVAGSDPAQPTAAGDLGGTPARPRPAPTRPAPERCCFRVFWEPTRMERAGSSPMFRARPGRVRSASTRSAKSRWPMGRALPCTKWWTPTPASARRRSFPLSSASRPSRPTSYPWPRSRFPWGRFRRWPRRPRRIRFRVFLIQPLLPIALASGIATPTISHRCP